MVIKIDLESLIKIDLESLRNTLFFSHQDQSAETVTWIMDRELFLPLFDRLERSHALAIREELREEENVKHFEPNN